MKSYRLLLVVAFFATVIGFSVQAQTLYNGVGHIPAAYQERWNRAGLLRDMSTVEPKLVVNVASLSGNDDQKVQTALNQARSHVQSTGGLAIIYFPTGDYDLTTTIPTVPSDSNIVFQGAGSDRTTLVFQNMKNLPCFNLYGTAPDFTSQSDLDQNFNKGDSIIHAVNGYGLSSINPGDWVHFIKRNFDYNTPNPPLEPEIVGQITRLEAKGTDATGEWGEIKDVANMNYVDSSDPNYSLKVRKVTPVQNIGIEDLTIKRYLEEQATVYVNNINFEFAVNCWVKGVESYKASRHHFNIGHSSQIEVSGCYFHEAMYFGEGGWGYGVATYASTTNCLIENNIFRKLRHAMVAGGGSNCNVWTFNYSREKENSTRDLDLHAKYPFGHLFEHNIVEAMASDDFHGDNGPYNTFVRNMATETFALFKTMQQWSTLGNDEKVTDDLLGALWHNWDYGPAVDLYAFIENYTLPVPHNIAYVSCLAAFCKLDDISYYYSSKPEFLDGYTWPTIGPKTRTGGYLSFSIPAKERFNSSKKTYLADPTPKPLTTSGTLAYDQTLPDGHTLTGNVTVPDNIILFIANGATINLNGYYIKCQGSGQIIKQGSATFSPYDISIKSGSVIKGQYPSINSAIANVVSGRAIVVGGGSHTVSNNLTVASGVALQINAGTTLNFTGNYKLRIEGTLTAVGTYTNKVTFTRSGGTWYGIEFWNGAFGSEIWWANINNAQYGVRMYNTNVVLSDNSVKYNAVGIRFENQSDGVGIVRGNVVAENSSYGIECIQYSDPLLFPNNVIRYNNSHGVFTDNTSAPDLGRYWDQGHNSLYWNVFDIWSEYPGTIYALYSWWGSYPADPSVTDNVDASYPLDYDPNPGMGKAAVASASSTNGRTSSSVEGTLGMAEVNRAHQDFRNGRFEQALALFEGIVQKYPDHFAGRRALAFVSRCLYKLNRRNEVVTRMNLLVQNHAGKEVFGLAQSIVTGELVKNSQYAEAIVKSQAILSDFPKTTLAKYALYDLGSIYWYRLEDQKTGEAYYRQLIAEWPDDDLTISALATLGEWKPAPSTGIAPALTNTQNVPAKYALSQNFPNPFNPQTMIQYELPEASHITVKIYNLFGQEVRTLVAGQREAGYHSEIWDGRNDFGRRVASGVYFYRLSAEPNITQPNGFQFTRKMVLTQ